MSVPALFRRPDGGLAPLRPAAVAALAAGSGAGRTAGGGGGGGGGKPPVVAQLEGFLDQARKGAARESAWSAQRLELDAARQALDALVSSPASAEVACCELLARVWDVYAAALRDAMGSAHDRVHLEGELCQAPHHHAEAVAAARAGAQHEAGAMEEELLARLQEVECSAAQELAEALGLEEQLAHYRRHVLLAQREQDQLKAANARALGDLLAASSWPALARLAGGSEGEDRGGARQGPPP